MRAYGAWHAMDTTAERFWGDNDNELPLVTGPKGHAFAVQQGKQTSMAIRKAKSLIGIILQITMVCATMSAPAGHPGWPTGSGERFPAKGSMSAEMSHSRALLLADRQQDTDTGPVADSEPEQPGADDRKNDRRPSGSDNRADQTPMQPFNPSEKIKADQAVDFPSDI